MSAYCDFAPTHPVHAHYHDHEYGMPLHDDDALFGRLVLEINQAGLSWETILRKREAFERAYDGFEVARVAAYGEADRARLLADAGIIRNRLKVDAAIHNAGVILGLQAAHGSFAAWIARHADDPAIGLDTPAWVRLFKRTFRFTGGEITGEFLMSTGVLPGAHRADCPAHARCVTAGARWARGQA